MIHDTIAIANGVIFKRAYDILNAIMQQSAKNMDQSNSEKVGRATFDVSLFVPVVVNCSFACELFLKAMLPKKQNTHKLDKLFMLLSSDIQTRIKTNTINKMEESKPTYNESDFQSDLVSNNNKFTEWRYFHEGNSQPANLLFLSCFI